MRVKWLGASRSVYGMMREAGQEYDDLGQEFVDRGLCEPVVEPPTLRGPLRAVDKED